MYFAKRGPSTRCVPLARRSIEGEASVFRTFLQFELDSGEFNPRRRKRPVRDPLRLASCKLLLRLDLTLVCVCAVGGGGGGEGEGEERASRRAYIGCRGESVRIHPIQISAGPAHVILLDLANELIKTPKQASSRRIRDTTNGSRDADTRYPRLEFGRARASCSSLVSSACSSPLPFLSLSLSLSLFFPSLSPYFPFTVSHERANARPFSPFFRGGALYDESESRAKGDRD